MKLIDRYLIRSLVGPLAYCLSGFVVIFVLFDIFDNLSEFIEARTPLLEVVKYYLYLLPSLAIYIVPISLLLATLYSLSQLTKNNELTAMRASGVSLYRLLLPYLAVGFIASSLLAGLNQRLAPASAYWAHQFVRQQKYKGRMDVYLAHNLAYKNDAARRVWFIGQFDTRDASMEHVEVIQQRPDQTDQYRIQASRAQWLDGHWVFHNVKEMHFDEQGYRLPAPPQESFRREMTAFNEVPSDFINDIKDPEFLSAREISLYIERHANLAPETVVRLLCDRQSRMATPWIGFVVVLLGIPFGSQTGRKGALLGVILSLSMFFSYYVLMQVMTALGKQQALSPELAAWGPNLLFLAIGLALVYRMR
ncbi:MAG: LptF/LptG family permease [Candidatus Marinimicrobia bacterium]|nr:LptF/LptG family permease [Candidatus Neomarinimicrobiota bacterium]